MIADYDLQARAQGELEPGEKLLWVGRPDARRVGMQSIGLLFFGIVWTAFSIFWVAMAFVGTSQSHSPGSIAFPLFGVPFVLIGCCMLAAPFWAYRKGLTTVYAVTNRRALIISGAGARSVKSYSKDDIGAIERTERADGSGDVSFARQQYVGSSTTSSSTRGAAGGVFYGIPDARSVERILRETFKGG